MTPEEMQIALDKALESITKLENKNSELIDREKAARKLSDEAQIKADEAADEAARKAGDLEAIEKRLNDKHTRALKQVQDELDTIRGERDAAIKASIDKDINDTLRSSMIEVGVPKHLLAPLTSHLKASVEVVDGVPVIGGKPLADHLPTYWKSDEGKAYIEAPVNVGTGSTGVRNATADAWANPPKTADEQYRFAKLSSEDPALFNNLCDRFNMPERKV